MIVMSLRCLLRKVSTMTMTNRSFLCSSSTTSPPEIVRLTFAEMKSELDKVLLIDVRERAELVEDGRIKQSVNVPLGELASSLALSPSAFKDRYGFDQPQADDDKAAKVVVHCKAGIRAVKGAVALSQAGFTNVRVYDGIMDWVSNGGEVIK